MFLQLIRSVLGRLWRSFKALINGIWKVIVFPFRLFYKLIREIWNLIDLLIGLLTNKLPELFANEDTREFALDIVKTIISGLSLLGVLFVGLQFLWTYRNDIGTQNLAYERFIADRLNIAIDQIESDKKAVVFQGIYSLEEIANESPKYQRRIMDFLTKFVEDNLSTTTKTEQAQLALRVIVSLNFEKNKIQIDLSDMNLSDVNIKGANLSNANLSDANLRDAILNGANLRNANLSGAKLEGAEFQRADLGDAILEGAKLQRAVLYLANLNGSFLMYANLDSAILIAAKLETASLYSSSLRGAKLWRANLKNADLIFAKLGDANLAGANLESADLFHTDLGGANLGGANLGGANLRDANLGGAKNFSNKQIKLACSWEEAIYTSADWNQDQQKWIVRDPKANQQYIEEIRQDKASEPENPPDCSKWKRGGG